MVHNNDSVRNKLIEIISQGLMLKSIAINIGVDVNDLSRFKNGMNCLKQSDVEVLSEYLDEVHIPQWNTVKKSVIEPKGRRREISFDLLRELD
jgi:hypothetical protein